MRLVHFAGLPGSGKTTVIRRLCKGKNADFIANNERSAKELEPFCGHVDSFPFKSPCARIRQYSYRVGMMSQNSPSVLLTEPPGNCQEVSAPMLNQIYVNNKEIDLGPLITVIDGRMMVNGISKRNSEGLRLFNMIDESDIVIVSFADELDGTESIVESISSINEDSVIVLSSPESDLSAVEDAVFGDARYNRPLFN